MAISSQYYKDISKVEKRVWGMSGRQVKAYALLAVVGVVEGIEVFLLPDWAFLVFSLPTALVLGTYPVLLLLNKWKENKRKIALKFYYQDRFYRTGQIRRYSKNEFTQKKEIRETDTI